ncbi:phosphate ABC transporter permease subunit PstC [Xylocopilactobacillus apicola]|uniref:Phosphate transport system permease protein n=1 Tax=Xylocopilactobacillus apicola TaxID=2932184 RepID=A0AAU9DVP9_9LACO|nr:phosphate ABC transporter permease subunit PstC [Xylocopilactobacillus apicola]BDR57948.1 phosphate transport system permease protein [Xylocopilactobacillus apicola]
MDPIRESLLKTSKKTRRERRGRIITFACILLIVVMVAALLLFVTFKGLATFFVNHVNPISFLFGTNWNPGQKNPQLGALPMFLGSILVTIFSAIVATPFAIGAATFMTEISPRTGKKFLQPVMELLVGIPSVVYGFIGLTVFVPLMRNLFGGSGFGILTATLVLFVMVLPTITSMTTDALNSVPRNYRESSLALGATRFQTIYKVVWRSATPGIMTAVVFGMSRAFGEALAVQMVIGNAALMPHSLISPASTLTSILTMGIGNSVMGTLENNALWSLALLLLLMSLLFNMLVRWIGRRSSLK